ncbi:MAG: hypothetical protein LKG24_04580 [Lacticaseibacillus songhuajiangensis]|jgi:predicted SnoaL-like aldol condensation-catalyzing enzyme|nr:hypothetical protein [Lacticaseibacillus songhuajiangensis]
MSIPKHVLDNLTENEDRQLVRVLEDGNRIAFHALTTKNDQKFVTFDVFEIHDGQARQSYHAETPYEMAPTPSGHTQLDGPSTFDQSTDTSATRQLVIDAVNATLVGGPHLEQLHEFMQDSYIQHHVGVPDGLATVEKAMPLLKAAGRESIYTEIEQVIAEKDFALVISSGHAAGINKYYFDLFRVANGKIAEHWDIVQPK